MVGPVREEKSKINISLVTLKHFTGTRQTTSISKICAIVSRAELLTLENNLLRAMLFLTAGIKMNFFQMKLTCKSIGLLLTLNIPYLEEGSVIAGNNARR